MQFTLTPRMITLTMVCFVLLCVLIFLAGLEIGQKMAGQEISITDSSKDLKKLAKVPKPPKEVAAAQKLAAPLLPAKP